MERLGNETETKSQLVLQICSIPTRLTTSCYHQSHHLRSTTTSLIDWYRVLQVDVTAKADMIRKSYRRLALQLHPDKNKHPKAERAFKLVSEAYVCLSDERKRAAFDQEREKIFCAECSLSNTRNGDSSESKRTAASLERKCSTSKVRRHAKVLQRRFLEEATVIENCLKTSGALRRDNPVCEAKREQPIFNPSDYFSQGYPHFRT